MNVLFVEANHDSTTKSVHDARRRALTAASVRASHALVELYGARATATDVSRSWHEITGFYDLISGMGHGDPDEFTGHNNLTVFRNGSSATRACQSAVVHLFSCNCGEALGGHLVADGARGFVGYTDFVSLPNNSALIDHFVATCAEIDSAILRGDGSGTAKGKADSAYKAARAKLLADPRATPLDLAKLDSNHDALVGPWTSKSFGSF